jgi:hypothetical protein
MGDNDNDNQQILFDLVAKSLKTLKAGKIDIDMEGQPALKIDVDAEKEKINIYFIRPTITEISETESRNENRPGLFDKLKTAKEFAQKLTDNGLTLSFLRKGKEARPTLSRLITRSDDIQVDSVRESTKLGREL